MADYLEDYRRGGKACDGIQLADEQVPELRKNILAQDALDVEILQKPVPHILVAVRTAAERTKPSFCTIG